VLEQVIGYTQRYDC